MACANIFLEKRYLPEGALFLKKRILILLAGLILLLSSVCAQAYDGTIGLLLNGRQVTVEPGPFFSGGRVFVPVRFVAENMGAVVEWDEESRSVIINYDQGLGDAYLKGQVTDTGAEHGIMGNLISARELKNILDDDSDGQLADYRQGRSGGDRMANDPLVIDIRKEAEYKESHVPGAVWIAEASAMGEDRNMEKLKRLLSDHVAGGGKGEVVIYCYTGNTSGLVAGVLGARGLPARSMMFGFDIAWRGTKYADRAIKADMEDGDGNTVECGG